MAMPVEVESEGHLLRIVREHDTVIASCFPRSEEEGESEQDLHQELISGVTLTVLCRITDPNTVRAAGLSLPDDQQDGTKDPQGVWWLFFSGGEMVYAAGGSPTPGPKLSRLAALLERSPGTLAQLSRQDQVSRRQRRVQESGENNAARRQEQGSSSGGGSGGGPGAGPGPRAVLIFVAGDRSKVGKSSTCLGLLGSLLRQPGLRPGDLAYIKPATQCEKPQLVTEWCEAAGVACRGIGPVVFYKGFTREFLRGGAGTSEDLLQEIRDAVGEISSGKKVVVVDGVGYPAVGSICGVSNGDVAAALGAPVLLVGKSGVGDAVDSYNLNACFFEARGVRVLGGVFNRISTTGYYSLERCREAVTSYFAQANPNALPYGFVPEIASLKTAAVSSGTGAGAAATAAASPASKDPAGAPPLPAAAAGAAAETRTMASGEGDDGSSRGKGGAPEAAIAVDAAAAADKPAARGVVGVGSDEAAQTTPKQQQQLPVTDVESEEDLESFLAAAGGGRLVLVDFGAEWCKNCKAILPFVHGLPERLDGAVAVAAADVDEAADLADSRDVSSIPHFLLFRNGVQVDTYTGSSETELLSKLNEHLPSAGPPSTTCPSPAGGPSGGAGSGRGPITGDKGRKQEEQLGDDAVGSAALALGAAEALIDAFDENVDVARLLRDIRHHADAAAANGLRGSSPSSAPPPPLPPADTTFDAVGSGPGRSPSAGSADGVDRLGGGAMVRGGGDSSPRVGAATEPAAAARSSSRKSREEVEAEAAKQGASGG